MFFLIFTSLFIIQQKIVLEHISFLTGKLKKKLFGTCLGPIRSFLLQQITLRKIRGKNIEPNW